MTKLATVSQTEVDSKSFCWQEWVKHETTSNFGDALSHFLLNLKSPHTRRNYARDLRDFFLFARSIDINIVDIHDISEKLGLLWLEELKRRHFKYQGSSRRIVNASVARSLSALSSFLDFSLKRGLIAKNCIALIPRPKTKRDSKTNALTGAEVKQILQILQQKIENPIDANCMQKQSAQLQYAVIFTLLSVGMRVDELCELRIGDLEETPQYCRLHMTAKGGENHSPIIHDTTVKVIKNYIAACRPNCGANDLLFVRAQKTKTTTKLTQTAIYKMIQKIALENGIKKRLSPHSLRATLATLLHKKGIPIGQIQELLNHKQITTTAIYIKKAQELDESAATKINLFDLE